MSGVFQYRYVITDAECSYERSRNLKYRESYPPVRPLPWFDHPGKYIIVNIKMLTTSSRI